MDLPDAVRTVMTGFQERMKTACRFVDAHPKWVAPQNLHITLLFLGNVPEARVPDVIAATDKAAAGMAGFDVRLQGLELLPPGKRDRKVVVAEVHGGAGKLEKLHQALAAEALEKEIPVEDKRFHAHLTLARLTSIKMISRFQPIADSHHKLLSGVFPVAEIVLFESILEPEGPRYFPLHRAPLTGAAGNLPVGERIELL